MENNSLPPTEPVKKQIQIGPVTKVIKEYYCDGCTYLYDKSISMGYQRVSQYFCQHADKLQFISGKSIGATSKTPDWCPETTGNLNDENTK